MEFQHSEAVGLQLAGNGQLPGKPHSALVGGRSDQRSRIYPRNMRGRPVWADGAEAPARPPPTRISAGRCILRIRRRGSFTEPSTPSTPGPPPAIRRSCFPRSTVCPATLLCSATIRGRTALRVHSHRSWMEPSTPIPITESSTPGIARVSITDRSSIFPPSRNRRSSPSDGWRPWPDTGNCRRSCRCSPAAISQ